MSAILLAGFGLLMFFSAFLALHIIRGMGSFQLTHFHFNYSDEFLRRGFMGELLRIAHFPVNNLSISLLCGAAILAFVSLLVVATARTLRGLTAWIGQLYVIFLVACPGITLHLMYSSFGYLDVFPLLMACAGLVLALRTPLHVALPSALVLTTASILTHEIGLLTTGPLLLAALMTRFSDEFGPIRAGASFALLAGITGIVWHLGAADSMTLDEHVARLAARATDPHDISRDAVIVLHRTLDDNVGLLLPRSLWWYLSPQLVFAVFGAPYLFFVGVALQDAHRFLSARGLWFGAIPVVVAVLSPLALYVIGHDYFRWWSYALTNFFLLGLFLCRAYPPYVESLGDVIRRNRGTVFAGAAIGVTMGGIGGLQSFSIHTAPAAMIGRAVLKVVGLGT